MDYLEKARQVLGIEIEELERMRGRLDGVFVQVVECLRACVEEHGKVVICGVGKSGNIAQKMAATFNSTGATAVVLHSQDALHGDLGLLNAGDAVLLLSASGETDELINLLPHLRRMDIKIIALTGGLQSTLARHADLVLDTSVEREACPLGLAPTSSSTVTLALGDALAMVLLEARGFRAEDFALLHPGGSLGRALLTRVADIMRQGERLALCTEQDTVMHALQSMTRAKGGAAIITNAQGSLAGIFTQGDFVRAFQTGAAVGSLSVAQFMSRRPVTISDQKLAAQLLQLLKERPVDDVIVVDADNRPVGLVDTQDLAHHRLL